MSIHSAMSAEFCVLGMVGVFSSSTMWSVCEARFTEEENESRGGEGTGPKCQELACGRARIQTHSCLSPNPHLFCRKALPLGPCLHARLAAKAGSVEEEREKEKGAEQAKKSPDWAPHPHLLFLTASPFSASPDETSETSASLAFCSVSARSNSKCLSTHAVM